MALVAQRDWRVIFCENTLSEGALRGMLTQCGLPSDTPYSSLSRNLGSKNKGLGELDMLTQALQQHSRVIERSETVSYFTGRRLMSNHFLLERTESLRKDALLSNPNFVGLDGQVVLASVEQNLFNDMFFSMRTNVILAYSEYFQRLVASREPITIGSEQILFNYVRDNRIDYEWIHSLGLIRRDESIRKFLPGYIQRWDVI
jgi:hypothetical protein